ncbi:MAG: FAD dependent oxidoreductase, partial [uncultured Thermomicrobiales bacterium]
GAGGAGRDRRLPGRIVPGPARLGPGRPRLGRDHGRHRRRAAADREDARNPWPVPDGGLQRRGLLLGGDRRPGRRRPGLWALPGLRPGAVSAGPGRGGRHRLEQPVHRREAERGGRGAGAGGPGL